MPPQNGEKAPDWILSTANGERISLYAHAEGKQAVMIFWATWCPFCRKLMPELEALREELQDQSVNFYALNVWEDSDPKAYLKDNNLDFILLLQADAVAQRYGVGGTPGLFVMDAEKNITYIRMRGTSNADAVAAVKKALGVGEDVAIDTETVKEVASE